MNKLLVACVLLPLTADAALAEGIPTRPDTLQLMQTEALYGDGVYLCHTLRIATMVMNMQYQYGYAQSAMQRMDRQTAELHRIDGYGEKPPDPVKYFGCMFVPNGTKVVRHFPTMRVDVDLPGPNNKRSGVIPSSQLAPAR